MKLLIVFVIGILMVSFVYAQSLWSDFITTEFTITDVAPVCDRENYLWKEWDEAEGTLNEWDAMTSCYELNGVPQICCPEGYKCGYALEPTNDNYMKCYESREIIDYCEDYTEQIECESAPPEIGARSVESTRPPGFSENICEDDYKEINSTDPNCIRYSNCLCYWDGAEGKCESGIEYSKWYCDYPGADPEEPRGEEGICVLKKGSVTGNCDEDDFIRITWTREWVGTGSAPLECSGSFQRNIPCPTKLFFFTTISFILTTFMIAGVYAFLCCKKRK
jgi:hypothetical protein